MHFSKLRLSGFKSFVDPAELAIEPGLTGVVGPNGCGKSNLVEALRWAMGESSAKRMRGAGMDDVIFSGTQARPSRNIAEVSLLLDNSRGRAGPFAEIEEIEVTRRIERGAGSDYRVNGREARARDVQLLFADAASGAHSAALVSQGRIGAIINARPVDRRALIEEAAGISGLHARRHEAELRLKAAEANLLRLDDVLVALATQLDGLKKQARQAQRYRRVSEQIRRIEAIALHLRWRGAGAALDAAAARLDAAEREVADRMATALAVGRDHDEAGDALAPLRQAEAVAAAELQRFIHARQALDDEERRAIAALAAAEERLAQLATDLTREEELRADANAAIERLAAEIAALTETREHERGAPEQASTALAAASREVAALETELTRRQQEVADQEARRASYSRQIEDAQQRRARLDVRRQELARQRTLLDAEIAAAPSARNTESVLAEAGGRVETSRAAADEAALALRDAEARLDAARQPLQGAETKRAKLRAEMQALTELLAALNEKRWLPVLDSLEVEPGYEAALGAALGDDLIAPLDGEAPIHWRALPRYLYALALPAGAAPLSDFVKAPSALTRRLAQIGVVADGATAEAVQSALVPGQRLVTRDGGLWRWDGLRRAPGTATVAGQRLRQRNRLAELGGELRLADRELAGLSATFEQARTELRRLGDAERDARDAMRQALAVLAHAQERDAAFRRREAAFAARRAALDDGDARLASDLAETASLEDSARSGLGDLPDPATGRADIAGLRARLAEHRRAEADRHAHYERLNREAAARAERFAVAAKEQASWESRAEGAARQLARIEERRDGLRVEIEKLTRRPGEIAHERDRLAELIAASTARRSAAADALALGETRFKDTEAARKNAEAALGIAREDRVRAESLRDRAAEHRTEVEARIAERLDCPPGEVLASVDIHERDELPPLDEAESRLERLLRERENIGPVNLVAESEAAEVEARYEGLGRERDDLTSAIARLRQGISALNREGRERMLAALAKVDEHFGKLFERLFGGGRAHLRLETPPPEEGADGRTETATGTVDPLEAGLEILASPPGKKLQAISLLSGGEQALTALALIFAVFLTNPAPVCVLDEVDAPLDDANVDRFCRLVAEIADEVETRFLIITHHRLTMARMDRLYGVTMAEQGISQLVSVDLQQAEQLRKTA